MRAWLAGPAGPSLSDYLVADHTALDSAEAGGGRRGRGLAGALAALRAMTQDELLVKVRF